MAYTVPGDVDQRPVAIDGAGTLGRRIATVYAAGGSDVRIFDLSEQQRAAARDHVAAHVDDTAQALGLPADRHGWVETYDEFKQAMEGRPGYVVAPWAHDADNEAHVKTETQATIRNVPFSAPKPETGKVCMVSGRPAEVYAYFAKSY